ncbi:DUF1700 domain-containing protein [Halalkalibacter okhensis]|uniref:DUF1700 domain-containing protein n=1 Tax=Halalkalibacter okhensis TaxID=333138 RepID=A0A0B0IDA9_9BACI|nr:DUF1700 domain-containing protein [Halalkalibacter okhensis]KHF40573.1 hypothetical protein LQ50_08615 [Halalkalibacter okhensis]
MNKQQFLMELDRALQKMSLDERQDILNDFEEHFAVGLEEGKTEGEITCSLGSPQQIAKDMLASYHLEKAETTVTTGNIIRAVWAVIGLGFFNLVIVLGPFIALVSIVFAGWAVGVSFIVSPLLFLINIIFYPGSFELFELFITLALCGLGLFIAIGMFFATRTLTQGFLRYLKFNVKLVKGGLKHD